MIVEIPLNSAPAQTFVTQLGTAKYRFTVIYNSRSGVWTFDLATVADKQTLLTSIPMVLGVDLLQPYQFNIGRLIVGDTGGRGRDATADDLGTRVKMFWYSVDEG